jgi:putative ABC transport system substrate-binding protein
MKRRELLLLLGSAMTTAPGVRAQQKAMPVIGFLGVASLGPYAPYVIAFREGFERSWLRRGKKPRDRIPLGRGPR